MSLADFTRQYMQTALWSTSDQTNDQGGDPLDKNYTIEQIAPETRAVMEADCATFYAANSELWPDSDDSTAGHDFWLTRNHHGAGFWDGDYEQGDKLTELAQEYRDIDLYVGDDGLIHG